MIFPLSTALENNDRNVGRTARQVGSMNKSIPHLSRRTVYLAVLLHLILQTDLVSKLARIGQFGSFTTFLGCSRALPSPIGRSTSNMKSSVHGVCAADRTAMVLHKTSPTRSRDLPIEPQNVNAFCKLALTRPFFIRPKQTLPFHQ